MKGTKNAATLETLLTSGKMEQDKIADQILEFTLPDTLIAQLEDYARVGHGTPSDILAAVFNLLLSRYTGQTVVTTTYQNHPLQIDCSDDPIFSQLMEQVNVPQPEISALPSIYFIHSRIELATLPTSFALLYDTKNDKLTFAYNLSLFDKTFIQQLADSYQILLSGIVKNPNQEVSQLPILTEAQQRQEFIDWNQTRQPAYPTDKTIHEVFEKQAEKTPQNIAVVYEDEHGGNRVELTYADLNGRSNQLARFIREQYKAKTGYELTPDTFIGVCVDRSVDIIIGKLAILKAGAAYVALDPAYPEERLKVILEDADIKLVLSQTSVLKRLDYLFQDGRTIVSLDADKEQFEKQAIENLPNINKPTDLAYLMYTSGSTGKPKGVMVEHKGVPNMAYAAAHDVLQLEQTDRTLEFASINFDAAAAEIWPPLLIGASLYVLPEALRTDPEGLCDYLERHAITVLQFMPPTMLVMIPRERKLPQIRIMLVAGEKCPEDVMRHWSQGRRLVNAFGPAETTVCSSFSVYHEGVLATQVGLPIANVTNYVLDQHLQPVPVGVTGEYCVGGIGVARGYLKRLEITAQKFVVIEIGGKKELIYRTGDRVRRLPDGNLLFVGRIDRQVKIRGRRVELSEIEAVMTSHSAIQLGAVLLKEYTAGQQALIAFYVLNREYQLTAEELKKYLEKLLPDYMVPAVYVVLDAMPLSKSGKIEYKLLEKQCYPAMEQKVEIKNAANIKQQGIAQLINTCLSVKVDDVNQDIFTLGAASLEVQRIKQILKEKFMVDITTRHIYAARTVANIEKIITSLEQGAVLQEQLLDFGTLAKLDDDIGLSTAKMELDLSAHVPKKALITGATGYVGASLLHQLLVKYPMLQAYCLTRGVDLTLGRQRLIEVLTKYHLWDPEFESRIIPVLGNLAKKNLGLSPEYYAALSIQIDTVYHCAADVNFCKPYSELSDANVGGTDRILRFVSTGRVKPLHYVSTVGIFGCAARLQGVESLDEHEDTSWVKEHLNIDIGYDQAKWVAEQHVVAAKNRGLPITIFRLGFVLCNSENGVANPADFWSRMVKGCLKIGYYPSTPSKKFLCIQLGL